MKIKKIYIWVLDNQNPINEKEKRKIRRWVREELPSFKLNFLWHKRAEEAKRIIADNSKVVITTSDTNGTLKAFLEPVISDYVLSNWEITL